MSLLLKVVDLCVRRGNASVCGTCPLKSKRERGRHDPRLKRRGKSTTLRTLSGLHRPQSGTIEFKGESITGSSSASIVRAGLRACPGRPNGLPGLSVLENLRMGGHLRNSQSIHDKSRIHP
ncbi:ATP-binding cassette domain-containing protein [Rhodococcus opacus]|nr:ATP-binding cassette domain-containing protein [Rhodococcus opacus]